MLVFVVVKVMTVVIRMTLTHDGDDDDEKCL